MKTMAMILLVISFPALAWADYDPPAHSLFDTDAVQEIHLTFEQPAWFDSLVVNYSDPDNPEYLSGQFDWDGNHFDNIGVRFKGNSSYWGYPTEKKSFKLDFNQYVDGQNLEGLDAVNLNNCFKDPSYVREKVFWETAEAAGLPYIRVNYAALYINDEYWGLYTVTERVDNEFLEFRFGTGEEGNLFKGEPHGTLEYLGNNESDYYNSFELKTNEDVNDWSGLVHIADNLNNSPSDALPDSLADLLDVNSALTMLALNQLTVNLDSYHGSGHNYYLYQRERDERFVCIPWDANEAWGVFNMGMPSNDLVQLPPFWLPFPPQSRPLAYHLWAPFTWGDQYLGHLRTLMSGPAEANTILARMEELRTLVDPFAATETRCMFSYNDFLNAMSMNIGGSPGLEPFIRDRQDYLTGILGSYTAPAGLVLNELMAANQATLADEFGDFDDWLEITNTGPASLSLAGLTLTDNSAFPALYALPDTTLEPGEYLLVWCDNQTDQGPLHAGFKLSAGGETIWLLDQGTVIEQVVFPSLADDVSFGCWADASGLWQILSQATPAAENQNPETPEEVVLYLNEFMAKNDTGIQDETGAFEDWVEIWNPGPAAVEMGGLFLTDDLSLPTRWSFPDTTLEAGGFLLVWCDDDTGDGPLHTNFKLGASGEELGLYGRLSSGNEVIDSHVFGVQAADISQGRASDGANTWVFFLVPTPGSSNSSPALVQVLPPVKFHLQAARPNPFNPTTELAFTTSATGFAELTILDTRGLVVKRLLETQVNQGEHTVIWHGRNEFGRPVSSGVYFARLKFDGAQQVQRLALVR